MPRFVYVTSRERRDVFERLSAEFATQPDVRVIQDRRRGERRRGERQPADSSTPEVRTAGEDRRRRDRRAHRELEPELRSVGSFIAAVEDARPWQ
jgi:hypothetical protein